MKVKKIEQKLNPETLLVTIDVGKKRNYGYARCTDGNELEVFDFFNSGIGFEYFLNKVERYRDKMGLSHIVFGLESTGSYGEALIHYLYKRGNEIVQVNPLHTKRVKEIRGNSQNKTDIKDPKVIADIIALNNYLTVIIPEGASAELRRLSHLRDNKQADINRVFNRIESLMMLVFPEFLHIMKTLKTKTAVYLLRHLPVPNALSSIGLEELADVIQRTSRKRLGRKRAEALYRASLSSGGINEGIESIVDGLHMALDELELHERQLLEIEQKLESKLKEVPYSRFIMSIKGVGILSTAAIIGEAGDLRKYRSKKELLKLAGLNLYEISSGKHKGEKHITKRGRSLLRKILFYAALNVSKKSGILFDTYQRHLDRGMKKIKAITAISRKLIGIIFALVRDCMNYDEGYGNIGKAA